MNDLFSLFTQVSDLTDDEKNLFLAELRKIDQQKYNDLVSLLDYQDDPLFIEDLPDQIIDSAIQGLSGFKCKELEPGEKVEDYRIIKKIGEGSAGQVYLAYQISLARVLALKVTPNQGREGKMMAQLEHPNIVRVYAEQLTQQDELKLIAMDYIGGPNLHELIKVAGRDTNLPSLVERMSDPLRNNSDGVDLQSYNKLKNYDAEYFLIWLGFKVAQALGHAHQRGILHLDIKPANILLDAYCIPYLSDFNISKSSQESTNTLYGGTLNFMSPEQRNWIEQAQQKNEHEVKVDERSDIYSLGKTLLEVAKKLEVPLNEEIRAILNCATQENPAHRYAEIQLMSRDLHRALQLYDIKKEQQTQSKLGQAIDGHPLLALFIFSLIPNLIGSLFNIGYNKLYIIDLLSPRQVETFKWLVLFYNTISYPLCVAAFLSLSWGSLRFLAGEKKSIGLKESARLIKIPQYLLIFGSLGWLPGAILFPFALSIVGGFHDPSLYSRFAISFVISWIIACSHSFLLLQFLVVRSVIPRVWNVISYSTIQREFENLFSKKFHYMSGLVPVFGCLLFLFTKDSADLNQSWLYKVLIVILMAIGSAGFCFAMTLMQKVEARRTFYQKVEGPSSLSSS